jgi:hypothetical protein
MSWDEFPGWFLLAESGRSNGKFSGLAIRHRFQPVQPVEHDRRKRAPVFPQAKKERLPPDHVPEKILREDALPI